jgi:hypothetical protein
MTATRDGAVPLIGVGVLGAIGIHVGQTLARRLTRCSTRWFSAKSTPEHG